MTFETKATCFLGIARVSFCLLDFTEALSRTHREESDKAKVRLLSVFKYEGCLRHVEEHFIDAAVNKEVLQSALRQLGISLATFKERSYDYVATPNSIPELRFTRPIACLSGLHRVRAAEEYLDQNDQWWYVKLYDSQGIYEL